MPARAPLHGHCSRSGRLGRLCSGGLRRSRRCFGQFRAASGADASAAGGYADFDRTLLSGAGQNTTDLSRFERGNPVMPGSYNTDIFLNNAWVGRSDVRFAAAEANASATPCVDRKMLDQLGLHPAKLSD